MYNKKRKTLKLSAGEKAETSRKKVDLKKLDQPIMLNYHEYKLKIQAYISPDRKSFWIRLNSKAFLEYPRRQDTEFDAAGKLVKVVNEIETQLFELNEK